MSSTQALIEWPSPCVADGLTRPRVVLEESDLVLLFGSLLWNSLIQLTQHGHIQILIDSLAFLNIFHSDASSSTEHEEVIISLKWRHSLARSLGFSSKAVHSFTCFTFTWRYIFLSPVTILYRNLSFCLRIARYQARCSATMGNRAFLHSSFSL